MKGYSEWVFHGEGYTSRINEEHIFNDGGLDTLDDMDGILHDAYNAYRNIAEEVANTQGVGGPTTEAKRFIKLVEEGKEELYPGCHNFSKLSFTVRLFLFKCLHGLSNEAFGDLLKLLR